jgi:probable rRNA maturation factor
MNSDPLISYRRKPARLDLPQLEQFAEILRDRVAKRRAFHCLITGDAELRRLNRQFLGNDHATDVLSFPADAGSWHRLSAGENSKKVARSASTLSSHLGDLAISLPRARAQAREHGHDLEAEVRILMLHGVLHLLGMDHETDSGEMARAEKKWRKAFGLPGGLIERAA